MLGLCHQMPRAAEICSALLTLIALWQQAGALLVPDRLRPPKSPHSWPWAFQREDSCLSVQMVRFLHLRLVNPCPSETNIRCRGLTLGNFALMFSSWLLCWGYRTQSHTPTDFLCHTALSAVPPRCWCCSTSLAGQMPRGISAKLYLPEAVSGLRCSWMAHPSQWAHYCTTRGAPYSYTTGIIILFSHSFQYSVFLPSVADAVVTWEFSPCHRQTQTLCWRWRMNNACFCRPACPSSLSCKSRQSAAWHSWVRSVEQGRETISSFSYIWGSEAVMPRAFLPGELLRYCPDFHPLFPSKKLWLIWWQQLCL